MTSQGSAAAALIAGLRSEALGAGDAERALDAAATAHPTLPAPDADFVAFACDHLADRPELDAAALDARLPELLVTYHAARGHPTAVTAIRAMLDKLRAPLRRTGADAAMIDEVLADLPSDLVSPRTSAAARILGFTARGPLAGWLRVIAVRAVIERRRRTRVGDGDDDAIADLAAPALDPELELLRRRYAAEFRTAFAAAVAALDAADRALLRQHHLDGVTLDALARLHGVHRATAARRLSAARDAIFGMVRRRLLGELAVGGDTVDSIIRMVRSEVDLSLERYL